MPGGRGLRDVAYRRILGCGVVLGDDHHECSQHQADECRSPKVPDRDHLLGTANLKRYVLHYIAHDPVGHRNKGDRGEHAGDDESAVKRAHDLLARLRFDEHAADNGSDDRYAAQCERIDERRVGSGLDHQRTEQHRGDQRHGESLEEICGHAGAVPHVVADVVGDHRRIARVVLGNARFHLADQVRADIGPLGEDAAAEPSEDRNKRSAESKAHERLDDVTVRGTGRR